MDKLSIIYAGTPDFAVPALQALLQSRHNVIAVYTQPDRPAGRGKKIRMSPVKMCAVDSDIPVYQPENFKTSEAKKILRELNADVMIVAAYGLILPQSVLDAPKYGCLNIHASLLPRWRGAAPIHRAIESDDTETGITIMQMNAGLDTGDMLLKQIISINPDDTSQTIHDQLAIMGGDAVLEVLDQVVHKALNPIVQNENDACYARKLTKQEAQIDWNEPADVIVRKIQAFNPWPVAYSYILNENKIADKNKPIRILSAKLCEMDNNQYSSVGVGSIVSESMDGIVVKTGCGYLAIQQLQLAGKKPLKVVDFLNGQSLLNQTFGAY